MTTLQGFAAALGSNECEAAMVYDMAAKIAFDEFACLNFPPETSAHIVLPERVSSRIEEVKKGARDA